MSQVLESTSHHLADHDEFGTEFLMDGEHVKDPEEEGHEVERQDDPGCVEALVALRDGDEPEDESGDVDDDGEDVHDVPEIRDVVVQLQFPVRSVVGDQLETIEHVGSSNIVIDEIVSKFYCRTISFNIKP